MDEKAVTETRKVTELYGVGDLAAALKVPHGYVTDLLHANLVINLVTNLITRFL